MRNNAEDIHLLFNDPGELILLYEPMIRTLVQIQIGKGLIGQGDKNEVVQFVIDQLFERVEKIRAQYNEQALLRTYCAAVVRNLCKEWARLNRRDQTIRIVREPVTDLYGSGNPFTQTLIKDEMKYFAGALQLFGPISSKLILFLKAHFHLPVRSSDLLSYAPSMKDAEIQHYTSLFEQTFEHKDHEIYAILNDLILRFEYRRIGPDAVRKWIKARIMDLIRLMNCGRGTKYEGDTIQILAECYFMDLDSETEPPKSVLGNKKSENEEPNQANRPSPTDEQYASFG